MSFYFSSHSHPNHCDSLGEKFVIDWKPVLWTSASHILLPQHCCNFFSATAALPFGTIVVIVLIWTLVTSPLLVLGGVAGKNSKAEFQAPVRTTKYPREIPPLPWYRGALPQMAMAGILPFSAIYIELHCIFASVWGHRIYYI
ncbi:Transmembrane 9 superfamily member 3 [Camellia lanceoleosa]|uniref:Transmembrane 9 superfamily member 3 n=1 Tax=Camellia lanceoleosa TaxID=1840588 RepID=A0ACC0J1P0_9ERIC|nr:Transmembrane 9 superfamily member 3 [Camellia lanceoleosa]